MAHDVSQSVSHYHTPSRELMAHTHTLLWSSFSSVRQVSLHLLLLLRQAIALQDDVHGDVLLPFAFTYLLVGARQQTDKIVLSYFIYQ